MKIAILVNTLQSVSSFVYSNHISFFVRTVKTDPSIEFFFFTPHRMSIDNARNQAAIFALEYECDYLMFIDDDVLIPPGTLDMLLKADKDIIAGLVIIRGFPFNVMAFKFEDPEEKNLGFLNKIPMVNLCSEGHELYNIECKACVKEGQLQELVKCDAVGFSCCLIKTDVLKPLEPPYFLTSKNHTEDIYFCMKIRDLEPRPEVWVHTAVKCGHLLNPEPVEWANRPLLHDIYGPMNKKDIDADKRGKDYLEKCLAKLMNS